MVRAGAGPVRAFGDLQNLLAPTSVSVFVLNGRSHFLLFSSLTRIIISQL